VRTERVDEYWSDRFGLEPGALYREGITVVPDAQSREDNFAYVFVRGATCILSVGPAFVEATGERVRDFGVPHALLRDENLNVVFDRRIHHTVGPAYQGYAEKEDFLPRVSGAVRHLGTGEHHLLERLKSGCEPIAWQHSRVDATDSPVFAYFVSGDVVAIAHYSMWAAGVASIGVVTHPSHRSRGYGRFAVSAAMAHALEHGRLVVYQTLTSNVPSVALATSLGCRDYARTVAVHLVG